MNLIQTAVPFFMIGPFNFIYIGWGLIILFVVLFFIFGVFIWYRKEGERDLSVYEKKQYIFDTKSEAELFKTLVELFGERFYVFPQVGYSHIVQVRKGLPERIRFGYWNSINRKSADFVLCDKENVGSVLVIELDGSSHQLSKRIERDGFINELMRVTNLPILHMDPKYISREYVKAAVESALVPK